MATVTHYARPGSIAEALSLLERPAAVALAGGTRLNPSRGDEPVEVVDLQALGLDRIEPVSPAAIRIGAMVTLQQLADAPAAPLVVREAARRELPSTLRAQATVGGAIASADAESELLATLLVHRAVLHLVGPAEAEESIALESHLAALRRPRGRLITSITIASDGTSAVARTGRTRADRPIVAVAARVVPGAAPLLAASGVARTPILLEPGAELRPPADFRGSADYRRALVEILGRRALESAT